MTVATGLSSDHLLPSPGEQVDVLRQAGRAVRAAAHPIPVVHAVRGTPHHQRLQRHRRRAVRMRVPRSDARARHGRRHPDYDQECCADRQHRRPFWSVPAVLRLWLSVFYCHHHSSDEISGWPQCLLAPQQAI